MTRNVALGDEEGAARRLFLDKAWHAFVCDGVAVDGLDEELLRSWRRARDTRGIDPARQRCRLVATPSELEARRAADDVHRLALPILQELGARLAESRHVLAYFDPAGWMLSLNGDAAVAALLGDLDFRPGANWGEAAGGANGPGAAPAEQQPAKALATGHDVEAWQAWTCSAAPVLDPGTGALLGLVDLTGPSQSHEAQALVAAQAVAQAIQERIRSARLLRDQVIEYAFRVAQGGDEGLVAVDRRGRVIAANDAARRRLGFEGLALPEPVRGALEGALDARARHDQELSALCPGAGPVRLQARPVHYDGELVGAVVRVVSGRAPRGAGARGAGGGARYDFGHILGGSEAVTAALRLAHVAARNDLPVVLQGESGTGKELFAQAIHAASARAGGPFVAVNCGCLPASLLEAELFGYEPGTFTGGRKAGNAGKFEEAEGGTLFLDEVTELPAQAQTALLRVLQEREVVRLGGSIPRSVDVRVLAASNTCLADEVRAGRFRSDLFFRLNVLSLSVPPLRERLRDVPLLARAFLREAEGQVGRAGLALSAAAMAALEAHAWPGNVRELRNAVLRAAATAPRAVIEPADLPAEIGGLTQGHGAPPPAAAPGALAEPAPAAGPDPIIPAPGPDADAALGERDRLLHALQETSWNVARTALQLGVSRMTLYRRIHRLGIHRT